MRALLLAGATSVVFAACVASTGRVPDPSFGIALTSVSSQDLTAAGVDVMRPVDAWPAPKVAASAAVTTAELQLAAPKDHGPLLAVGRGTARQFDDPASPIRSVWVVAFGPGGEVPLQGPAGGSQPLSAPIALQLVLIDDQSGGFLRAYIKSGP